MSLDKIRARIADVADRLSRSLATDATFGVDLVNILDLIRDAGYDVRIDVAERDSQVVTCYRPSSSRDRTDEPNDRKSLPKPDRAVRCTVQAWHCQRTAISATDMDAVFGDLVNLVYRHWGERDVLTLLPRLQDAGIEQRVLGFVEAAATQGRSMAVLHTDLDKFKAVNDEFGEPGGDAVLKEFSSRFRKAFAELGVLVRTGGEEFSAFLLYDDAADVIERAEEFRAHMETQPFEHTGRPNTCSIGLAIYQDVPATDKWPGVKSSLHDARAAERRAKEEGRDRIRLTASVPQDAATAICVTSTDLVEAALLSRIDLDRDRPCCCSTKFGNVVAMLLARKISGAELKSVSLIIDRFTSTFGLTIGSNGPAQDDFSTLVPMSANLPATEWMTVVARALLRATFATGGPLSAQDELSFAVSAADDETGGLFLNVTRQGSPTVCLRLAANVETDGVVAPVNVGRPWYPLESSPPGAVRRWVAPQVAADPLLRLRCYLSPCLLLPIGDQAIGLAKSLGRLIADVVEIDDRPVVGGGLPDFWQSNLARVIRACLRNPNIHFIIAIGLTESASNTLERLTMPRERWDDRLHDLQRRLSIASQHLEAFRDRAVQVVKVEADTATVLATIAEVSLRIPAADGTNYSPIDLEAESRRRRLPLAPPAEANRLLVVDGLRTRTLADAYPQAIQLLRSSEAPPQTEPTERRFREFPCFKLVMTNPLQETIPDYWVGEELLLQGYYDRNFKDPAGLFGGRLLAPRSGGRSMHDDALLESVDALRSGRPTRRIVLPVMQPLDPFDQPLGLCAIQTMPRFRQERWQLDFQWIWRTVEALVGFPFSAYASITWSHEFFDAVRTELAGLAVTTPVELGELTYVALSFHMFLDVGDVEIARAIVLDASG